MVEKILETLRFRHNGKTDVDRIVIVGVLFGGFLMWRLLGAGTHGTPEVMRIIEHDLVEGFRQFQRSQTSPDTFDPEVYEEVVVEFSNVSMSAPVTHWEINEDVIVRFDYTLKLAGATREAHDDRYVRVNRKGAGFVSDSSAFGFYLHLLL